MSNEKNKSSSSSRPAKRSNMVNNFPGPRVYTATGRAEYRFMVLSLTSTSGRSSGETNQGVPTQAQASNPQPNDASIPPGSSGQTSLRVPSQARASNPQPIRLNDASIPPGSSGQTSLRVPTQAQASNPQPIRLNDAPIRPGSSRQTSLPVPTLAHVSNPQSIRLNDAPIHPGSSGQTSLLFPRQAHVSARLMGLYEPLPNRYQAVQQSSASSSLSLPNPFPFPPASVWPRSSTAGTWDAQASSSRPSLPSPPVPPSVPEMLPTSPSYRWSPPSAPLVSARLPEYPSSLPSAAPVVPYPPQDQGAKEPWDDDLDYLLIDDDGDYSLSVLSPFRHVTGTSNGEQQGENVPPPGLTNQPSGSLNLPVPDQNGPMMPPSEHGPSSLYENVAPQVHATLPSESQPVPDDTYGLGSENIIPSVPASSPSMDLLNVPNYQHMLAEGIAPPVHATLPYENSSTWYSSQNGLESSNVPPYVAPSGPDYSNDQQWGPSLGYPYPQHGVQQGTVPTNVPFRSPDCYSFEEKERYLAQIGFATVPSWHSDWHGYPSTVFPSTNNPSSSTTPLPSTNNPLSSSTPANLPPCNLQG